MKTTCSAIVILLSVASVRSQEPPVIPVTPVTPALSATPAAAQAGATARKLPDPGEPGAGPPVVRIPAPPLTIADGAVVSEAGSTDTAPGGALAWSGDGVELRAPPPRMVRTNWTFEPKGILPRVAKPERKGVGGFFAGFANLFNPLAPVEKGVESRTEHWYDGQINRADLPRGFRDERYHEPKTDFFTVGLEPAPASTQREP